MKILFICAGNSIRSQIAEGWARHLGGDKIEVASAGISAGGVHPQAIAIMKDAGLDISGHKTRPVSDYLLDWADLIITVCDEVRPYCIIFPKDKKHLHWSIPDPFAMTQISEDKAFGKVRDMLQSKVRNLLDDLDLD